MINPLQKALVEGKSDTEIVDLMIQLEIDVHAKIKSPQVDRYIIYLKSAQAIRRGREKRKNEMHWPKKEEENENE